MAHCGERELVLHMGNMGTFNFKHPIKKKINENWMKSINGLRNAFNGGSLKVFISDHDTPAKGMQQNAQVSAIVKCIIVIHSHSL
jgi:hypothetical protein